MTTNQRFSKKAILGQLQIQLDNAKNAEPGTEHPGKVEALVFVKEALGGMRFNKAIFEKHANQRVNEIRNAWHFDLAQGWEQLEGAALATKISYWELRTYRTLLNMWY